MVRIETANVRIVNAMVRSEAASSSVVIRPGTATTARKPFYMRSNPLWNRYGIEMEGAGRPNAFDLRWSYGYTAV